MANRFTNIATTKYDPLTLEEVMMVPLAKQKSHDDTMDMIGQAQIMDSQRLSKDDEVVQAELDKLRGKASEISSQMMEKGLTRGAKNRFQELRRETQQALSGQGVLGKAKATYDKALANKTAVMANKNLSQQQKEAGLAWAMNQYTGVGAGGVYTDYVGADYLDVNEKLRNIAKEMSPQEIADNAGYSYEPTTGVYTKGGTKTERLTPEEISGAVYQAAMNDDGIAAYLKDATQIGIISDPQGFLKNAAINAGNIYAVNNYETDSKVLPKHAQGNTLDDRAWLSSNGWYSKDQYSKTHIDRIAKETIDTTNDNEFDSKGNYIGDTLTKARLDRQNGVTGDGGGEWMGMKGPASQFGGIGGVSNRIGENQELLTQADVKVAEAKKARLQQFKAEQGWNDVPDKYAAELMNQFSKEANAAYSKVYSNANINSTLNVFKDIVLGEKGGTKDSSDEIIQNRGTIMTSRIMDNNTGQIYDSINDMAKDMGMSVDDLLINMKAGSGPGLSPGNADMPMGLVFNFPGKDRDATGMNITVENSPEIAGTFNETATLVRNMRSGKSFETEVDRDPLTGQVEYRTYVLDIQTDSDPVTGLPTNPSWVPRVLTTTYPINDKAHAMSVISEHDPNDENVRVQDLNQVTASNMHDISRLYDSISQQKPK